MPKLQLSLFDPIEVEIVGQGIYKINTLSSRMLGDFQKVVDDYSANPGEVKADTLADMLTRMLPGMTKEQALEVDIRHIVRIAEFLAAQIDEAAQPGAVKN